MKKILKFTLQLVVVLSLSFGALQVATFAAPSLPLEQEAVDEYKEGLLPGPVTAERDSLDTLYTLIVENAFTYVKIILAVVAILLITIMGVRLVAGGAEEDTVTNVKKALTYTIVGLVLVSMAQELAQIFDLENRTILDSPSEILRRVKLFDSSVELVITFIKYVIGAVATLMAVRSGFALVIGGANEDETSKHKKSLAFSAAGLLLVYVGHIFITRVFYKIDKTVYTNLTGVRIETDPYEGVRQIAGITNLVVSFVGPLAVLMLIVGALMYITAAGEEDRMDRAKRVIITAVVGIVIIFGAFALVSTFLAGRLPIES